MSAISRGLFTARIASSSGSRSFSTAAGAAALSFCRNTSSRDGAAVPRILRRVARQDRADRPTTGCRAPRRGTACRWCVRASVPATRVNSSRGSTASMPVARAASSPGASAGPNMPVVPPLVRGLQEERRLARAAVEQHQGARLDDAGQVEELVVLPERLLAGAFGRALKDGDAVADRVDHLRPARRELVGGKISVPRNTGCAESSAVRPATRATLNNARCMKHPLDSAPLRARLFLRACRGWPLHDRYGHVRRVLLRVMDGVVRHDSVGLIVIVAAGVQVAIEAREVAARHLDAQPVARRRSSCSWSAAAA